MIRVEENSSKVECVRGVKMAFSNKASRKISQKATLELLRIVWEEFPDLRFGQLINSISAFAPHEAGDIFYIEDEDWPSIIDDWVKWFRKEKSGAG